MRIVSAFAVAASMVMGAMPAHAATATGNLVVTAVVVDRCVVLHDRAGNQASVICDGVTRPFKIVSDSKSASTSDGETRETVFF